MIDGVWKYLLAPGWYFGSEAFSVLRMLLTRRGARVHTVLQVVFDNHVSSSVHIRPCPQRSLAAAALPTVERHRGA